MDEGNAGKIVAWRNTQDVSDASFSEGTLTVESHLAWHARIKAEGSRLDYVMVVDGSPIGVIYLGHIDKKNMCVEVGVFVGEPECRGKGYADDAMRALIGYAFGTLGMNRVYLKCFADNGRAIRLYRRCGFNEEGVLRQEIKKGGVFRDVLVMSILKGEFRDE